MTSLTPPTDNLYKFIAISGLIIFVFCLSFPTSQSMELASRTDQLIIEMDSRVADMKADTSEIAELRKIAIPTEAQRRQLKTLVRRRDKNYAVAEAVMKTLKAQRSRQNSLFLICVLGSGIGTSLSYFGFRLWYHRVQKFQDAELKWKAENPTPAKKDSEK